MEHQHEANKENHAGHNMRNMDHAANPSMGMAGHNHHEMMIMILKKGFMLYWCLLFPLCCYQK